MDPNLHINGVTCNDTAFAKGGAILHGNGPVTFNSLGLQDVNALSRNE